MVHQTEGSSHASSSCPLSESRVLRRYLELSVEPLQQEEPQEEVRFLSSSKEVCCILQEPITLRQRQQLVGCLRKKVVAVFTPSAFAAVAAAAEAERSRQQQQDLQRDLQQFEALKRQPLESEKLHASMAAGKKSMFQQQQQQQLKIMDSCSLLNPLPPTTVFADTDKWQRQRQALQFLQLLLRKRLARQSQLCYWQEQTSLAKVWGQLAGSLQAARGGFQHRAHSSDRHSA
ncbi:hypothetical protein cyc_03437 [Cyclospora cayetanensis]|uniref:Uncharacterized protein n=1 Tax=Cyclospora cayetanensis TaxID=88456 RepID=A0A1D3D149_9EIME|nr:hypothetical protein cyc_03437 [Cyclospora cayetanensis]